MVIIQKAWSNSKLSDTGNITEIYKMRHLDTSLVTDLLTSEPGDFTFGVPGANSSFTETVVEEVTDITSQYYDSDGNLLENSDGASRFSVTKNTKTTTANIDIAGKLPETVTVNETSVTDTYQISSKGNLINKKTSKDPSSMSTINLDSTSKQFQDNVLKETKRKSCKVRV